MLFHFSLTLGMKALLNSAYLSIQDITLELNVLKGVLISEGFSQVCGFVIILRPEISLSLFYKLVKDVIFSWQCWRDSLFLLNLMKDNFMAYHLSLIGGHVCAGASRSGGYKY